MRFGFICCVFKLKQAKVKLVSKYSIFELTVTHQEGFFHAGANVVQFFLRKHHTLMRVS